ncbi:MAG: thermosome subunit, partial [Methanomicrobia archaeon]|nr:thermosome subunit [Methanomicrobia archaeon]
AGLDVYTGKIINMWKNNVIEPLRTKQQAVESAADAAIMILKIDDVIASRREAPMPPPGAGGRMPPGGMPMY